MTTTDTTRSLAEPAPEAKATAYVVLSRDDSGYWTANVKPVQARSAEAAIRAIGAAGTYIAVPERSWKPVTVKAEQRTVLTLEDADA